MLSSLVPSSRRPVPASTAPASQERETGRRGGVRRRLPVGLLLAGLLVALGASPAAAHNTLRSTDPADGSTITTAPAQVTLTFDQPALALGTEIVVTGPEGVVSEGDPQLVDSSVAQPLTAALPAGGYTVEWRVTSADGHPLSGTFGFTTTEAVGVEPTPEPTAEATPDPTPEATEDADATAPAADVTGTDAGAGADEPTDEPTVVPISAPAGGVPAWAWVVLVAGALALLVGGGAALAAARRRADAADAADAQGPVVDPDATAQPQAPGDSADAQGTVVDPDTSADDGPTPRP